MSRQGVTLMCYWNGTMMSGPHGISYEGASPKPIRVGYGITHNELVDRIYGVTGFDKQSFKLKIICRYPACREYIPVPIDDDESIDIMFDVARQPGTNCLELYVEREPLCSHNPINVPEPTIVDNQTTDEIATDDAQVDSFLDPGPVDNSILVLQNQHRSEAIWMGEMVWQPYTSERLGSLPDSLLRDPHVWRTVAPLICFDIVEWHHPERVLRQFGLCQEIPVPCDTETKLHIIDRRGKHHYDWKAYHGQYIKLWEAREESIATGKLEEQPMHYHDPYMVWYRNVTRRLITPLTQRSHMRFQPSSGTSHLLVQSLTTIHNQCACALDSFTSDGAMKSLECIQTTCVRVLQMIGETRHLKGKQSVISTKPITIIPSSADDANNTENQQHEECISSSVHTAAILTKAPFVRGRGRGRGRARGSIKSQGGGYCNVQSVVVETSPRSSLSTHSAPEALQPDNDSDRQLHMKDTEVGSMIEPVDLGSAETSPESEKETCVREKSPVQSFLMYKEIKRDILPSTRPMHLSKGDKMAQSVRLLEPEDESMHLLGKEDLERTVASPKVGSKFGSCNLSHEQSDHPTFPKKKRKHI